MFNYGLIYLEMRFAEFCSGMEMYEVDLPETYGSRGVIMW